jgi:hypothetical protein
MRSEITQVCTFGRFQSPFPISIPYGKQIVSCDHKINNKENSNFSALPFTFKFQTKRMYTMAQPLMVSTTFFLCGDEIYSRAPVCQCKSRNSPEAVDMNGRFQMQGGKNWFFPKEMNANRFFCDSHWLEIWSNHFYPSMGPNGGSVAMDSGFDHTFLRHSEI